MWYLIASHQIVTYHLGDGCQLNDSLYHILFEHRHRKPNNGVYIFNIMLPYSLFSDLSPDGGICSQYDFVSLHACVPDRSDLAGTEWRSVRHRDWEEVHHARGPRSVQAQPAGLHHRQQLSDQEDQGFRASCKTKTVLFVLFFSAHRSRINKEMYRRMWSKDRNRYDWRCCKVFLNLYIANNVCVLTLM